MKNLVLTIASLYGMTAGLFRAFWAPSVKKNFAAEKIINFLVGGRFTMY